MKPQEPDFYLRHYEINDVELAALKKFQKHRCSARFQGEVNRSITVAFTGCAIGTAVEVSCHCGAKKNITDFKAW